MEQQSSSRQKRIILIICGILAVIWIAIGSGFLSSWLTTKFLKPQQTAQVPDGNTVVSSDEADIAGVAQRVSKSVVSIVTVKANGAYRAVQSAGTGIIISQDGYILTNKHVVNGVSRFEVVTSDGTKFNEVSVVGSDPLNDIAFLKLKGAKDLAAATLGNSGTVRVGQKVIAIGNSLGQYQNTVTSGIISGKGRPVEASTDASSEDTESLTDLLQTDAAINPGNSGGPLLNMSGQVIGINTAIVSDAQSMGFAIPINAAKGLVRSILTDGKLKKSYIGVRYIAITPEVKAKYKLAVNSGAYISTIGSLVIDPGGPADKAGLKAGDIITKIDGKAVGEQGGLGSIVAEYLPGETVTVTFLRNDQQRDVKLTLSAYKA